jgi:ABC-type amino acid transport substrate-binding protein
MASPSARSMVKESEKQHLLSGVATQVTGRGPASVLGRKVYSPLYCWPVTTNIWAGAILVFLAAAFAVYLSVAIRSRSPRGGFFADSERAAGIFNAIGTMFSVLLALVILLSVETYTHTKSNANAEADSVVEQFRLAEFFPSRDQYRVQSQLVCYGRSVVEDEWPLMSEDTSSPVVDEWSRSIDSIVDGVAVRGSKAEVGFELFLSQGLERQAQRRGRLEGAAGTLPSMVWPILILGAVSILIYVVYYADKAERVISQVIQVGLITALLGGSLVLIRALDHPFSDNPGAIQPDKMETSLQFMEGSLSAAIDSDSLEATLPCDQAGLPRSSEPFAKSFPEGSTMARIVEEGKLTVGISHNIALFGELDPVSGEVSGFDVDLAREIARELGLREDQIEFVDLLVEDRVPYVAQGKVDMVVMVATITPERLEVVDFSRPYFLAGQSLLVDEARRTISNVRDLPGKRVCVPTGGTSIDTLTEMAPLAELAPLANIQDCVTALKNGEVDAFSTDDIVLAGFAAENEGLVLVGGQLTQEPYGVILPKGQTDMVQFVNGAITAMIEDGRWGKLYYQYMADIPGLAPVPAAKERLSRANVP